MSAHDGLHLVGCFALMMTVYRINPRMSRLTMMFLVFNLGFLWEIFDQCNKWFELSIPFLDSRGSDYKDLLYDLGGVILAVLFLVITVRINDKNSWKGFRYYAKKR